MKKLRLFGSALGEEIVAVGHGGDEAGLGAVHVLHRGKDGEWHMDTVLTAGPMRAVAIDSRIGRRSFVAVGEGGEAVHGRLNTLSPGVASMAARKLVLGGESEGDALAIALSTTGFLIARQGGIVTGYEWNGTRLVPGRRCAMAHSSVRIAFDPHVVRLTATWMDPSDFDRPTHGGDEPYWQGESVQVAVDGGEIRDLAQGHIEGLGPSLVTCGASGDVLVLHRLLQ